MTTRPVHAARAAFVAAALVLAPAALAAPLTYHRSEPQPRRHEVPEFDPAAAGALIALLAGGALHVASRRNSK